MKDTKFRGYVADEKQFVYGYLMPNNRIYQTYEPKKGCCGVGIFSVVSESIGQYTGCRDINNKKIYEQDILKSKENLYYKVVYKNGGYMLKGLDQTIPFIEVSLNDFEIIGNSFEMEG